MKRNELKTQIENYVGTIKEMELQHEQISLEIAKLTDSKFALIINMDFEGAEKLDDNIEKLTRRQGTINSTLLQAPQATVRNFKAAAQELIVDMKKELAIAQDAYDVQIDAVKKAKDLYVAELMKLTEARGKGNKLNGEYIEIQVQIEELLPQEQRVKEAFRGVIGSIQEPAIFRSEYTKTPDEADAVCISEKYQKMIYPIGY